MLQPRPCGRRMDKYITLTTRRMKQLLLLILLFIQICGAIAQSWCPPGAKWHYRINISNVGSYRYVNGTTELKYTNTVTINNITCKELKASFYGIDYFGSPPYPAPSLNPNYFTLHTYENNKVLYIHNAATNSFDTIVDFNSKPGDTWLLALSNGTNCLFPREKMTVLDTTHIIINGQSLKRVRTTYTLSGSPFVEVFIEKLACTSNFMYIQQFCIYDQTTYGRFVCYEDDNFPVYMTPGNTECIYPVSLEDRKISTTSVNLYPNPNNGHFSLELAESTKVEIINSLGARVYHSAFDEKGTVNLNASGLAKGLYYIHTKNASGQGYTKFIKE